MTQEVEGNSWIKREGGRDYTKKIRAWGEKNKQLNKKRGETLQEHKDWLKNKPMGRQYERGEVGGMWSWATL